MPGHAIPAVTASLPSPPPDSTRLPPTHRSPVCSSPLNVSFGAETVHEIALLTASTKLAISPREEISTKATRSPFLSSTLAAGKATAEVFSKRGVAHPANTESRADSTHPRHNGRTESRSDKLRARRYRAIGVVVVVKSQQVKRC